MSLLTDDEINEIADKCKAFSGGVWPHAFYEYAEAMILAKLSGMELPEPVGAYEKVVGTEEWQGFESEIVEMHDAYSADQLRQAYAQGAASQLLQAKADSEWQERNIKSKVDRLAFNLFTRKEPA